MPSTCASLPGAAKTATPAAVRLAIALAVLVPLHGLAAGFEYSPPSPRLRLTTLTFSPTWFVNSQSSAAAMSEKSPPPVESSTLMATTPASGATPEGATAPPEVMTPLTAVPCPSSSSAAPAPLCVSPPPGQQPTSGLALPLHQQRSSTRSSTRSAWSVSMPVSSTATFAVEPS